MFYPLHQFSTPFNRCKTHHLCVYVLQVKHDVLFCLLFLIVTADFSTVSGWVWNKMSNWHFVWQHEYGRHPLCLSICSVLNIYGLKFDGKKVLLKILNLRRKKLRPSKGAILKLYKRKLIADYGHKNDSYEVLFYDLFMLGQSHRWWMFNKGW